VELGVIELNVADALDDEGGRQHSGRVSGVFLLNGLHPMGVGVSAHLFSDAGQPGVQRICVQSAVDATTRLHPHTKIRPLAVHPHRLLKLVPEALVVSAKSMIQHFHFYFSAEISSLSHNKSLIFQFQCNNLTRKVFDFFNIYSRTENKFNKNTKLT